jgi:hypothetical protein
VREFFVPAITQVGVKLLKAKGAGLLLVKIGNRATEKLRTSE